MQAVDITLLKMLPLHHAHKVLCETENCQCISVISLEFYFEHCVIVREGMC